MPALVCLICAYLVTRRVFVDNCDMEMMDSEENCFSKMASLILYTQMGDEDFDNCKLQAPIHLS